MFWYDDKADFAEDIPGKAEENLRSMAMDHQKVDLKIEFCRYGTILLAIAAVSINLNAGGMLCMIGGIFIYAVLSGKIVLPLIK